MITEQLQEKTENRKGVFGPASALEQCDKGEGQLTIHRFGPYLHRSK